MRITVDSDLYEVHRNIPVPKKLIDDLAQNFNAKVVSDIESSLLLNLDREYRLFIITHNRDLKDSEAIDIGDLNWYKPVPLPIPLELFIPGIGSTITYNEKKKPIWFRIPKKFNMFSTAKQ